MENNALIQYGSTQDSRTFHAVRQTEQICAWTVLGIGGFLLLVLIANVLSSFFKHGIGEAILALLLVGVVLCLVFVGVTKLLELLVFKPWKAVRYSACAKRMAAEAQQNGLRPAPPISGRGRSPACWRWTGRTTRCSPVSGATATSACCFRRAKSLA